MQWSIRVWYNVHIVIFREAEWAFGKVRVVLVAPWYISIEWSC